MNFIIICLVHEIEGAVQKLVLRIQKMALVANIKIKISKLCRIQVRIVEKCVRGVSVKNNISRMTVVKENVRKVFK